MTAQQVASREHAPEELDEAEEADERALQAAAQGPQLAASDENDDRIRPDQFTGSDQISSHAGSDQISSQVQTRPSQSRPDQTRPDQPWASCRRIRPGV